MLCPKCGNQRDQHVQKAERGFMLRQESDERLSKQSSKDPDVLMGSGLASFFIGDGFFVVGILLSVMESSVRSLLWLLLLIPAFLFFGKGFSDVFQAKQIRRRTTQEELNAAPTAQPSSKLFPEHSVTERTTRQLK